MRPSLDELTGDREVDTWHCATAQRDTVQATENAPHPGRGSRIRRLKKKKKRRIMLGRNAEELELAQKEGRVVNMTTCSSCVLRLLWQALGISMLRVVVKNRHSGA